MKLLAFAASHRKDSINRKLARTAADMAEQKDATVDFAEYGDFDAPIYDDETFNDQAFPASVENFVTRLSAANGIILASPEYNWSFPGSLKNIIDWASVKKPNPFAKKTVLLLSASPSLRGGAQGLVHLKTPLSALGAYVHPKLFTLSNGEGVWDAQDKLHNPKLNGDLVQAIADFIAFTQSLS